jgi:hypothetical protein
MKVLTPVLKGTMADLSVGATTVFNGKAAAAASATRIATLDDKMAGSMLANEVLAYAKGEQNTWMSFAKRIIGFNAEARAAFIAAMKNDKSAMTKTQTTFGVAAKVAKKNTSSFGVSVSRLSTIAKAFNVAATVTGWREFVNKSLPTDKHCTTDADMLEHGSFTTLYEYAKGFTGGRAGRTADTWTVKLNKWLESNPVTDENGTDLEVVAYSRIVAEYNKLV